MTGGLTWMWSKGSKYLWNLLADSDNADTPNDSNPTAASEDDTQRGMAICEDEEEGKLSLQHSPITVTSGSCSTRVPTRKEQESYSRRLEMNIFLNIHREKYIIKSQRGSLESEHKNLYSSKYIASATFSLVTTILEGLRRNDKKNIFTLSLCAFANTFSFILSGCSWSHL